MPPKQKIRKTSRRQTHRHSGPGATARLTKLLIGPTPRLFDRPVVLIVVIFSLHAFGLLSLFDVLPGLYNPDPIIEQDWGLHFHHLKSLEAFWQQDKLSWGYNPLFMAGYPSNTIQDLSIKLFEFLALALSLIALTPIQWFKISAFIAMAAIPWLMYFSARNLFAREQIRNAAAVAAALLGTIYWWNSLPREMFFYGMIGYPTAAYATILGVSLFYRLAQQQTSWACPHCLDAICHHHPTAPRSVSDHFSALHFRLVDRSAQADPAPPGTVDRRRSNDFARAEPDLDNARLHPPGR